MARNAAQILYRREFTEYFHAKREAAKRLGTHLLPTNQEVHSQLSVMADALEGRGERLKRLGAMRDAAKQFMSLLKEFRPRLVGSVLTGTVRAGSDIDLHLYSKNREDVFAFFDESGLSYQVRTVQVRREGKELEFIHLAHHHQSGFVFEVTLFGLAEYEQTPTCSITLGPMPRASLEELEALSPSEPEKCLVETLDFSDFALSERLENGSWPFERAEKLQSCLIESTTLISQRGSTKRYFGFERRMLMNLALQEEFGEWPEAITDRLSSIIKGSRAALRLAQRSPESSELFLFFEEYAELLPEVLTLCWIESEKSQDPYRHSDVTVFVDEMLTEFFDLGFLCFPTCPVSRTDLLTELGILEPNILEPLYRALLLEYIDGIFEGREDGLERASELLGFQTQF